MVRVVDAAVVDTARRRTGSGPLAPPPTGPFRTTWTAATAVLTAATGVAQLLVNGTGRGLLIAVGLISLTVLGIRLLGGRHRGRIAELAAARARIEEQDRTIHRYRSAVERIVDRQFPRFEEEVEITVTVGARSGEDTVTERHRTTPKPSLIHRLIRPITTTDELTRPSFADLELTCELDGDDVGATVLPVSESAAGVLLLVLFQPGLRRTMEWSVRYRAPRLWDPLREDGMDRLAWWPSTWGGRETTIAVTDLTVHFVFPPGARTYGVRESGDRGTAQKEPTGDRRITWRDPAPAVQCYEWELWLSGASAPPRSPST